MDVGVTPARETSSLSTRSATSMTSFMVSDSAAADKVLALAVFTAPTKLAVERVVRVRRLRVEGEPAVVFLLGEGGAAFFLPFLTGGASSSSSSTSVGSSWAPTGGGAGAGGRGADDGGAGAGAAVGKSSAGSDDWWRLRGIERVDVFNDVRYENASKR